MCARSLHIVLGPAVAHANSPHLSIASVHANSQTSGDGNVWRMVRISYRRCQCQRMRKLKRFVAVGCRGFSFSFFLVWEFRKLFQSRSEISLRFSIFSSLFFGRRSHGGGGIIGGTNERIRVHQQIKCENKRLIFASGEPTVWVAFSLLLLLGMYHVPHADRH